MVLTAVLLEPHYDDAVLFASYTLLAVKPRVITVLGIDTVQEPEITADQRRAENVRAIHGVLGLTTALTSWHFSEAHPFWDGIERQMKALRDDEDPDVIWAPLYEEGGHEQHNAISYLVSEIFKTSRLRFYATYRRGSGRTHTDMEVFPVKEWPALKFAAMACFQSQINLANTRPWFCSNDCLREWVA